MTSIFDSGRVDEHGNGEEHDEGAWMAAINSLVYAGRGQVMDATLTRTIHGLKTKTRSSNKDSFK
jgi:hypothetical protein